MHKSDHIAAPAGHAVNGAAQAKAAAFGKCCQKYETEAASAFSRPRLAVHRMHMQSCPGGFAPSSTGFQAYREREEPEMMTS